MKKDLSYRVQGQYKNKYKLPNRGGEWKGQTMYSQEEIKKKKPCNYYAEHFKSVGILPLIVTTVKT